MMKVVVEADDKIRTDMYSARWHFYKDGKEVHLDDLSLAEIVTCKDCKYWDKEEGYCKPSSGTIEWADYIVRTSADSFCESGERRE